MTSKLNPLVNISLTFAYLILLGGDYDPSVRPTSRQMQYIIMLDKFLFFAEKRILPPSDVIDYLCLVLEAEETTLLETFNLSGSNPATDSDLADYVNDAYGLD